MVTAPLLNVHVENQISFFFSSQNSDAIYPGHVLHMTSRWQYRCSPLTHYCVRVHVRAPTKICVFVCATGRERERRCTRVIKQKRKIQQWKVFEFYFTCAPTHILQTLQGKLSILNLVCATICLHNPQQNNRLMWSNSISLFPGYETSCLTQIPTQQLLTHSAPFLELDIKEYIFFKGRNDT